MRRLVLLLLAAIAASSAYNFVLQEISLTGSKIESNTITCDNIDNLHVGGNTYLYDCYDLMSKDDPKKVEARKIVYADKQITTKASKIDFVITMSDQSTISFTAEVQMKAGVLQSPSVNGAYKPIAPPADATTTTTVASPTISAGVNCSDTLKWSDKACNCDDHQDEDFCKCVANDTRNNCKCPNNETPPTCKPNEAIVPPKAIKKTIPRLRPVDSVADAATFIVDALPPAIRLRGPGPVLPPIRQSPPVVSEEDEERRVKRAAAEGDPPNDNDDKDHIPVKVSYYILDEPGNAAAVWAAVIEGIILLVLVGACCYFFFWAPRSRAKASATAEPYKEEGPNYSVSYANSSFNQRNERIDAFQNPPAPTPAAPPRPANSAYMDDYITDNIGAMSRPGGTAQTAAPAAAPAFEPRHQRFDSSGLVTVNLS